MTTQATTKTPPRHNYAHTQSPIASIKRPRGPRNAAVTPRRAPSGDQPAELTPMHAIKPVPRNAHGRLDEEEEEEAVIHKKEISNEADSMDESSWVGRKVDALFSPVLNFLNQHESPCVGEDEKQEEDTHPATSSSTSSSSAPQYFVDDSDDDDMSLQAVEQPADAEEFNPWQFIKTLPAYQHVSHLRPKITLPAKDRQAPPVTLVLDLDETLVHCTVEEVENPNFTFPVNFHGVTYTVHVRLRPNLYRFLESCRGKFEVIVFTASQEVYANELLNLIDPEGKYIQHRLYRESCLQVEGNFLKDLHVLGRDLAKTVLVDNSPHAFGYQVSNGIPIESWFDDPNDRELLKLERFLRQIQDAEDVRPLVEGKFQSAEAIRQAPALI